MNRTVLIIGPNYFNFLNATSNAFCRLGWHSVTESYDNPIHPYTTFMKWRWKLSRHKDILQKKSRSYYNSYILDRFHEIKPDMVFIMNGEILEPETLDRFRESSKVAVWLYDSRAKLPLSVGHVDHADAMFCYENNDVEQYRKEGKEAYFLPQACDTDIYRPLDMERDIDILFIGTLFISPRRKQVVKAVIDSFPDRNIQIYGVYKPWYKGLFTWLFREHRNIYRNCNVAPEQVNVLYNRAKIALNIHNEQQKDGANPRVFEICGSKSYQLCDGNPYIDKLFKNGEIGIWHSIDELTSLIRTGLDDVCRQSKAEKAYQEVMEHHTYDVRMKTVIDTLKI